jgi:hypothetical protein
VYLLTLAVCVGSYIGVDINQDTKKFEGAGVTIVIGDQGDPVFWEKFREEHPEKLDIFLDDGGHMANQQVVTFEQMFWHVKDGMSPD